MAPRTYSDLGVLFGFLWFLIWFLCKPSEFLALFICENRVCRKVLSNSLKMLRTCKSRGTVALCVGFFTQLELFDSRNVAELTCESYRRVGVGNLKSNVISETYQANETRADFEKLPVPHAIEPQRSVIVIQSCNELIVFFCIIKGESLI